MKKHRYLVLWLVLALLWPTGAFAQADPPPKPAPNSRHAKVLYSEVGKAKVFVDVAKLPPCPDVPIDPVLTSKPIDPNLSAVCARKLTKVPASQEIDPLYTFIKPELAKADFVRSSAANAAYKAWAVQEINCAVPVGGSCSNLAHIYGMLFVLSTQPPSLTSGYSWNDFNYGNRVHVATSTQFTCPGWSTQTSANMSIGLAYGHLWNTILNDGKVHIFHEKFAPGDCSVGIDPVGVAPNVALSFQVFERVDNAGHYFLQGQVALNGQWQFVYDEEMPTFTTDIEAGLEFTAFNGDPSHIYIPLNFDHKNNIWTVPNYTVGVPWDDRILPAILKNRTLTFIDPYWHALDLVNQIYTSIAAEANIP